MISLLLRGWVGAEGSFSHESVHLGKVRRVCMILLMGLLYAQGTDLLDENFWDALSEDSLARSSLTDTAMALQEEGSALSEDTLFNPPKPPPPLRLIDSPLQEKLPVSGNSWVYVSTNRPFRVQIVRPIPQNYKGYPLAHGFDTWYLYIVKAEQLRIAGKVVQTRGLPIYLAIVSPAKAIEELPTVLDAPALMIKGIVDYGDTIVKHFKKERKRLRSVLDSLMKQPISEDELQAEEQERLLEKVGDSLVYAEAYYRLYRAFKQAKASHKALIQFFLSHPFNRSLTYSIYSAPYALPRYVPPVEKALPAPKRRRRS